MLVIVGESASGKSTLQKMLIERDPRWHKVVTYTTRPKREHEQEGIDYHFINDEQFAQLAIKGFFLEYNQYRGWFYGTPHYTCDDKYAVAVLTPAGLRALKKKNYDIISVYLCVDRRSRLIKNLTRGDDIEESYRRNLTDVGQFDDVQNEVDYVIENIEFKLNQDEVFAELQKILNRADTEQSNN